MFRVAQDLKHPLHLELGKEKGQRLKRGKSWMAQAEETTEKVCQINNICRGPEWEVVSAEMANRYKVLITMGHEYRENFVLCFQHGYRLAANYREQTRGRNIRRMV